MVPSRDPQSVRLLIEAYWLDPESEVLHSQLRCTFPNNFLTYMLIKTDHNVAIRQKMNKKKGTPTGQTFEAL